VFYQAWGAQTTCRESVRRAMEY